MKTPNGEETIFAAALALPAEQRAACLDQACGDDAALRHRVEALLNAHAAGAFLEEPAAPVAAHTLQIFSPISERPGDNIGRYKLLQQIGEGGCGVVYMAEQKEPVQRRAALKIIKLGMDTKQVIARFEAERQALALMDHPNIARVLDGGATEAGRPYFVMELVRGVKITEYCDHNNLPTRERLNLFMQVCRAIQHAHQKGIIHRDIKPSNILVTLHDGVPVPKVIDFGIAKATQGRLTNKTLFTAFEQFIGTPAYVSPEQAEMSGLDVDTRSDIYSLGVLLYELLTGKTPFDASELLKSGFDEMRRTICEKEPDRPSTKLSTMVEGELTSTANRRHTDAPKLISAVRGDLDWIVMKCLEKDRARRYETANGLARDIERHVNHEPVVACPPSNLYRFQKLVRRNKLAVIVGGVVASSLIVGLGISTWMFVKEREASQRAGVSEKKAQSEAAKSEREAIHARRAEVEAKENLWHSYLDQARANRWSGRVGRRFDSLDVLKKAAEIRPSIELRNEAIACMALPDLRVARQWDLSGSPDQWWHFDARIERYVRIDTHQGTISVRRAEDDLELMSASGGKPPFLGAMFSPNGQYLAVAFGNQLPELRVWHLNRKEVVLQPGNFHYRCMAFSHDSHSLAVAHREGGPIVIYDLTSAKTVKTLTQGSLPWAVAFDPADRRLAVSSDREENVEIRDLQTGIVIQTLSHPGGVKKVSWHPSGNFLATPCMDHNVYVWDTITGKVRSTLTGHEAPVTNVQFDEAGDLLTSDGWDATSRLWDFWTGRQIISVGGAGMEFTSDDRRMAGHVDGKPTIWERAKGRECWMFHSEQEPGKGPAGVDFSPDGRWLASAHSDGVRLWDLSRFREIAHFGDSGCEAVSFHPNGKSLFAAGQSGLQQWPMEFHQNEQSNILSVGPPRSFGAPMKVDALALSPDGRTLATVKDRLLRVFDAQTGQERHRLNGPERSWSVSFSQDGRWVAAAPFGFDDVMVWNLQSGALEQKLPLQHSAQIAFSPDNKWLVTASCFEYRFWEVGTWKPAHSTPRKGAADHAGILSFSAGGKMLAIAEGRNSVRLLDPDSRHEWATLESPMPSEITGLRFNSDGSQLASACQDRHVIQLWDLRLIRQQLAAMKLDWDLPPWPSANKVNGAEILEVTIATGSETK